MCENGDSKQLSEYADLYKTSGKIYSQSERRNKFLNEVKKRRSDAVDEVRGIVDLFENEEDCEDEPVDAYQYTKRRKNYGKRIMLSEWFAEIPLDLEENWLFKLCPVGVRNIVIASNGVTKVFNRYSRKKAEFMSNIPGGGLESSGRFSILDCIFNYKEHTYYILDLLAWNSCSLLKCSAEFRFYFLKTKLDENPDFHSNSNKFHFTHIEYLPAELPLIEQQLSAPYIVNNTELPLDGVLFYHKDADYTSGLTPLVGWLKPYMLPEMLQISVYAEYMTKKPQNYVSLRHYIESKKIKDYKKRMGSEPYSEMEAEVTEEVEKDNDVMDH